MNAWETIWAFRTAHFLVTLDVTPEEDGPRDYFQDEEVVSGIETGDIAWFQARVAVYLISGPDHMRQLVGADYLGACAYRSVQDFREEGCYFRDMVREACKAARLHIAFTPRLRLAPASGVKPMTKRPHVYLACPRCGCTDIARDAIARWNSETQDWELSSTFDAMSCDECGDEFYEADETPEEKPCK